MRAALAGLPHHQHLPKSLTNDDPASPNSVSPIKLSGAFPVSNRKLPPEKPHLRGFSTYKRFPETLTPTTNGAVFDGAKTPLRDLPKNLTFAPRCPYPGHKAREHSRKTSPWGSSAQNSGINSTGSPKSLTLTTRFLPRCLTEGFWRAQFAPKRRYKISPESAHRTDLVTVRYFLRPAGLHGPSVPAKSHLSPIGIL
jgi:hypothetical protein